MTNPLGGLGLRRALWPAAIAMLAIATAGCSMSGQKTSEAGDVKVMAYAPEAAKPTQRASASTSTATTRQVRTARTQASPAPTTVSSTTRSMSESTTQVAAYTNNPAHVCTPSGFGRRATCHLRR